MVLVNEEELCDFEVVMGGFFWDCRDMLFLVIYGVEGVEFVLGGEFFCVVVYKV